MTPEQLKDVLPHKFERMHPVPDSCQTKLHPTNFDIVNQKRATPSKTSMPRVGINEKVITPRAEKVFESGV